MQRDTMLVGILVIMLPNQFNWMNFQIQNRKNLNDQLFSSILKQNTVEDPGGGGGKGAMPPPPSTLVKDYLFGPSCTKY